MFFTSETVNPRVPECNLLYTNTRVSTLQNLCRYNPFDFYDRDDVQWKGTRTLFMEKYMRNVQKQNIYIYKIFVLTEFIFRVYLTAIVADPPTNDNINILAMFG